MAASREPLAMSRDGLLPTGLQKVSRRFGTPWAAVVATGAIISAAIALLSIPDLVKAASTVMLILFTMVNAAVLIMRRSGLQNYRPLYRAPGYPYLQYVGIVLYLGLAATMGMVPILTVGGFGLVSAGWYLFYVRRRTHRESALVYMVKNLVSRKVYRGGLEEELKQIALHRDQIVHDRFDRLIHNCVVLDLPGTLRTEQLFAHMADALTDRLGIPAKDLREAFDHREALTSTVIQPGLAIPHIIVEGKGLFDIVLVRCRDGVVFPGHDRLVKIIFALVGSDDQRHYHLKALMAIAHIAGEHDFVRRWLAATSVESLRDIIILSSRKRETPEIKR